MSVSGSLSVFVVLEVASVPSCHTTRKKLADFQRGDLGNFGNFGSLEIPWGYSVTPPNGWLFHCHFSFRKCKLIVGWNKGNKNCSEEQIAVKSKYTPNSSNLETISFFGNWFYMLGFVGGLCMFPNPLWYNNQCCLDLFERFSIVSLYQAVWEGPLLKNDEQHHFSYPPWN